MVERGSDIIGIDDAIVLAKVLSCRQIFQICFYPLEASEKLPALVYLIYLRQRHLNAVFLDILSSPLSTSRLLHFQ